MKKIFSILAGAILLTILAMFLQAKPSHAPGPSGTPEATTATKYFDHKNATYIIDDSPTRLVDGVAGQAAAPGSDIKVITRYFGNEAAGDLNQDGMEDIAFILTQDKGGSGTFFYATVALKTTDGYTGTNAVLLGDRIAPQSTEIRNDTAIVNYADRGPNEPMTANPSVGKSKYLAVVAGNFAESPIFLDSPLKNSTVASPLTVRGVARGTWYFEASFPIEVLDANGNVLGAVPAQAKGDWMTEDYVPFEAVIAFTSPSSKTGTLVLQKDNPSGLSEHEDQRSLPILFME